MKTINKKEILLIIISFFAGILFMYLTTEEQEIKKEDFNEILDSVYFIETYKNNNKESEGTAFAYKHKGNSTLLLTNEHVIKGEKIILKSNDKTYNATLLGKDKYLDIAVLKVEKTKIKTIKFSEEEPLLGDKVYVIGNPLGEKYFKSITAGILSGKNRLVKTETDDEETYLMESLQTDAAINHGSSGSPLINDKHELIGIVTQKLIDKEIEGMGFAISIEQVNKYLDELETGKKIIRPELGIKTTELSNTALLTTNNIKIPDNIENGIVVLEVEKNSNALNAKLEKGDIIVKVNDTVIKDNETLKYELFKHRTNDKITIKYIRNNKEKTSTIKLI